MPTITVPCRVRWAEHDPLFPYAWTDRLGETFADLDLALFSGVGHSHIARTRIVPLLKSRPSSAGSAEHLQGPYGEVRLCRA